MVMELLFQVIQLPIIQLLILLEQVERMQVAQDETRRLSAAPMEFDAVVTLDDALALHMEISQMAPLRAERLRRELLLILGAPLFLAVVLIGFNVADRDPDKPALADVFRFVLLER